MPMYEYHCDGCEHHFDEFQRMADAALTKCPACQCKTLRRVFGVPTLKTNTTFMAGAKYGAEQFSGGDPKGAQQYLEPARRAGVSINGKIYQHGLARFPGDPFAWCSDRDEVLRKVREIGAAAPEHGIKAREVEPKESVPIGEDILTREVRRRVKAGEITPQQAVKERGEIADSITAHYKRGRYKPPTKARKKR